MTIVIIIAVAAILIAAFGSRLSRSSQAPSQHQQPTDFDKAVIQSFEAGEWKSMTTGHWIHPKTHSMILYRGTDGPGGNWFFVSSDLREHLSQIGLELLRQSARAEGYAAQKAFTDREEQRAKKFAADTKNYFTTKSAP